jgi:hypothetical protein
MPMQGRDERRPGGRQAAAPNLCLLNRMIRPEMKIDTETPVTGRLLMTQTARVPLSGPFAFVFQEVAASRA